MEHVFMTSVRDTERQSSPSPHDANGSKREKLALAFLLVGAVVVYFWNLPNNGWGNPYYAAAAQSGAASHDGLLFASADLANAISVDKPPLHTALIASSVWLFGLSSWSVLAPNAILGVGSLALVIATVRSALGLRFAVLTGTAFLAVPVAVLMFRFNNPDTTLLFLWCLAGFLTLKAALKPSTWIFIGIGAVLALAFLTKQLQGLILVPALLVAVTSRSEIKQRRYWSNLSAAAMVTVTLAGSWLVFVDHTSASRRPWIGGSASNSVAELTFGYNGFGRLTGLQTFGAVNPKGYEGVVGADAGLLRLFSPNFAPEISWFLVPAILGFGITLHRLLTKRSSYRSRPLEKLMVSWFATGFAVVSFMTGNVHPYYSLMLVPPLCFLSVVAANYFAQETGSAAGRRLAAMSTMAAAFLTCVLLSRYGEIGPIASGLVVGASLAASVILAVRPFWDRWHLIVAPMITFSVVLAPLVFNVASIGTPQQGSFPQSGPVPSIDTWHRRNAEHLATDQRETYALMRGEPVLPEIAELIRQVPSDVPWPGLTVGGENAALYQLQTGRAVVAIGGFSGSDNFPGGEALKNRADRGEAGYYIHQPGILKWGPSSETTGDTVRWILESCQFFPIEHLAVYDLRNCGS